MPLSFTPISVQDKWVGSTWTVDDEDELARLIARVAVGQSRTVERILHETGCEPPGMPKSAFAGAYNLLTVKSDKDPYQRDGWMFQVIAWIAAHCQDDTALIRAPHMNHAHKGLDGLIVQFEEDEIARVVICEEKATDNPRDMVRDEVWPEFQVFEAGERDHELIATVTSLLDQMGSEDSDAVVTSILWEEKRAYRVAITVGDTHASLKGQKRLLKGYEKVVTGDDTRRRAEILTLEDMRDWMSNLADKAMAAIEEAEVGENV